MSGPGHSSTITNLSCCHLYTVSIVMLRSEQRTRRKGRKFLVLDSQFLLISSLRHINNISWLERDVLARSKKQQNVKLLNAHDLFQTYQSKIKTAFIWASHRWHELSWNRTCLFPSIARSPLMKQIFQKIFSLWSRGANVDIMWALQHSTGEADGAICCCDLSAARVAAKAMAKAEGCRPAARHCRLQTGAAGTCPARTGSNKVRK